MKMKCKGGKKGKGKQLQLTNPQGENMSEQMSAPVESSGASESTESTSTQNTSAMESFAQSVV